MNLRVLEGTYALCRLHGSDPLPPWFDLAAPLSVAIRRAGELSLIAEDASVPEDVTAVRGHRAFEVEGPLDLALTGVTAELSVALAAAAVPILPLATYDTDVILVPGHHLAGATAALRGAGHTVVP